MFLEIWSLNENSFCGTFYNLLICIFLGVIFRSYFLSVLQVVLQLSVKTLLKITHKIGRY